MIGRIERTIDIQYEKAIMLFREEISTKYEFFPSKMMYGKIKAGEINALINPPPSLVDPFKSRVCGRIGRRNGQTIIQLKIYPSGVTIGFIMIWLGLIIWAVFRSEDFNLTKSLIITGITLLPVGLGMIKVNWDRRRLESWLLEKIKNSA